MLAALHYAAGCVGRTAMNILMLCHAYPNYVPDLLLHGLRALYGTQVVELPRKDVLYDGILGQPYLEPVRGLMADDRDVDRDDIPAKLASGFYDLVLCDIRAFHDNLERLQGSCSPLALIDGEDIPASIRPGPFVILRREARLGDFSIPLPMALPREIIDMMDRHQAEEKVHSVGFLGARTHEDRNAMIDEVARHFPDALVNSWAGSPQWEGRDAYYRLMQRCRIVLSLPGAGFDTFRYWESAACNAVHLAKELPIYIPDDFRSGIEIVRFSTKLELLYRIESVLHREEEFSAMAARMRERLIAHHTTLERARQTISRLKAAALF